MKKIHYALLFYAITASILISLGLHDFLNYFNEYPKKISFLAILPSISEMVMGLFFYLMGLQGPEK